MNFTVTEMNFTLRKINFTVKKINFIVIWNTKKRVNVIILPPGFLHFPCVSQMLRNPGL